MSYLDTYLGQLDPALSDPGVMEIAINADGEIWVERSGTMHMVKAGLPPLPPRQVRDLAAQISNSTSNTFTEALPLVSAAVRYRHLMLRCQIVGNPAVSGDTVISIRVFRARDAEGRRPPRWFEFLRAQVTSLEEERREMVTAIRRDATATNVDAFLKRLVTERLNIIVSGGTSTGKTELGRRLLSLVPENERSVMTARHVRPTSSCRPRCGCGPIGSSLASCADLRPPRFSMRSTPATRARSRRCMRIPPARRWTASRCW